MRIFRIHWVPLASDPMLEEGETVKIIEGVFFGPGAYVYHWPNPDGTEYVTVAENEQAIYARFKAYGAGYSASLEWIGSDFDVRERDI